MNDKIINKLGKIKAHMESTTDHLRHRSAASSR